MSLKSTHTLLRIVGNVVLTLMAVGILYAGYISVRYWTGIGV